MPGMQEEAAEGIHAGPRAAPSGWRSRPRDEKARAGELQRLTAVRL